MQAQQIVPRQLRGVLTLPQAAEYLGIGYDKLWRWVQQRPERFPPAAKIGKGYYLTVPLLDAWLAGVDVSSGVLPQYRVESTKPAVPGKKRGRPRKATDTPMQRGAHE